MDPLKDKIIGAWMGLAIGDALGLAAKGLKPETIRQAYRPFDGYQDVRPLIGKGIKWYRMKGLYGARTQSALAVCDATLQHRKGGVEAIAEKLHQLSERGPEYYYGVYRHPDPYLRQAINSMLSRVSLIPSDHNISTGIAPMLAVPIALFQQKDSKTLRERCMDTALLMTRNPSEVVGTALTGWLICRLLELDQEEGEPLAAEIGQTILAEIVEICEDLETSLNERFPELSDYEEDHESVPLSQTFKTLAEKFSLDEKAIIAWICENASEQTRQQTVHPGQGHLQVLLPLALILVMKSAEDFSSGLLKAVSFGRESDKLGSLVGAFLGAIHGVANIPAEWISGLVNGKEIRARGEALSLRRFPKGMKDLFDMESALSNKEMEEGKRYLPDKAKSAIGKGKNAAFFFDDDFEDSILPPREDMVARRKFEKDKSRHKRDRRRNIPSPAEDDS
jgi:ADP-ribosylglycohydrolase